MASDRKIHAFEEVAKHRTTNDCWIIIHGKVYDVTPFMEDHPGGSEVLLAVIGKDAANDFEDVGHSAEAKEMMGKYYIGEIDVSTMPVKHRFNPSHKPSRSPTGRSDESMMKMFQFLAPLALLGVALAARYWTKTE